MQMHESPWEPEAPEDIEGVMLDEEEFEEYHMLLSESMEDLRRSMEFQAQQNAVALEAIRKPVTNENRVQGLLFGPEDMMEVA